MTTDRSNWPTRRIALADEGREPALAGLTPGQMVEMVWALTLEAWTFKDGTRNEPRLRRDVVSVVRGRRRDLVTNKGAAGRQDLADVAALEEGED